MMTITIPATGGLGTFDVVRVDFSPEAIVTEHPVELGAEVTDHVQTRPLRFAVDAIVTASPLRPAPVPFAVEDAIGFFESCLGQLLTVVIDGEGTFANVLLEAFTHSRTAQSGRMFACRFKQVRIASALSVTIPARQPAPAAAAGAPTEKPLGQQATTPVPDTSALKEMKDAALALLGFRR